MMNVATPYLKPLPDITEQNRPFWDALKERRFLVPRCEACGDYSWVPYPACRTCLSEDQPWVQVSGDATIYSFTIVHRGPGAFQEDVPYVIALAELVEQPRKLLVMGNVVGIDAADIRIDLPVRIDYHDIPGEDVTMWHFVPSEPRPG
jgi:uncharacterized OB-fold protein